MRAIVWPRSSIDPIRSLADPKFRSAESPDLDPLECGMLPSEFLG